MAKKVRNSHDENENRHTKFTANFFDVAQKQRNQYEASIRRLTELLGDYGPFKSRKEIYLSRLNTFDAALALFRDKRLINSNSFNAPMVNSGRPKQSRQSKFPPFFPEVSMKVVPHVDKYSTIPQAGIIIFDIVFQLHNVILKF